MHGLASAPCHAVGAGLSARSRIRCRSFPYRLLAFSAFSARVHSGNYNSPWPARHPGSCSSLQTISTYAGHLDFELATTAATLGELASDHLSWTPRRYISVSAGAGKLSRLSRANLA